MKVAADLQHNVFPVATASGVSPPREVGLGVSATGHSLLLWTFTATLFTSATLLFLVQPMFSKMVLPLLGGSSSVWNACMLFFQAVLLAGYLYAHLATRWLDVRRQAVVHLVLLALSLLTLPIAIRSGWTPPADTTPIPWLLMLLVVSLGVPFFLLSSSGPMLQRWFSHTSHPAAQNPYFLYAASNLGSMLALVAYPVLLEPHLRLVEQSRAWMGGYWLLVLLTAGCALLLWRTYTAAPAAPLAAPAGDARAAAVSAGDRIRWVLLAFVPSSLLLGVTTFLTTDIPAVPLLWVIPLALYLLTFAIVFSRRPVLSRDSMLRLQPLVVLPLVLVMFLGMRMGPTMFLPLHLLAFFVCAMVLHGELARRRPAVSHLTEFYLWISVGGVLGGVFNVLIAPSIFATVAEYPLALVLACLLRPSRDTGREGRHARWLDVGLPAALGVLLAALMLSGSAIPQGVRGQFSLIIPYAAALLCYSFVGRPLRFGLGLGAMLLVGAWITETGGSRLLIERSFYGVHKVQHDREGRYHVLHHGSTRHGAQSLEPARRLEPLTYYHREGPLGQAFSALPRPAGERSVAVVGLGTGSITCYGEPGERWTYFEIDPVVERIARDRRYFTFLSDCPPAVDVVLGDARLTLAREPDQRFDLIILDAFSSDAIPMHLMTREALAMYLEKLAPGGALLVHVTNRHLDLEPVLARLARDASLTALYQHQPRLQGEGVAYHSPSQWAVLARRPADLGGLVGDERWRSPYERAGVGLWTDDFSNIWSIFHWR